MGCHSRVGVFYCRTMESARDGAMSDRRPFVMIPLDIMARTDISSNAKMVYGVLAYRAGSKLIAWPSIPTISADAGTSGSSIRRGIRELVKTGIVIKHQSAGRNSNRYAIQPCQPEQVQPCQPGAQPCQPDAQPCQPDPRTIKEQEQIVSQIEQGFSLIENSQRIVNSTLQTLETMRMSVLKQAFEGKLVPQDPNHEPASAILERIKKEKS